jgi:alpha-glucosidase (family GH31 glycosyl hydrolase)
MKNSVILLLIGFLVLGCNYQNEPGSRKFKSIQNFNDQVKIETNDGYYLISGYSQYVVETSFIPHGEEYNSKSHAVLQHAEVQFDVVDEGNEVQLKTAGIVVTIKKDPFQLAYTYKGRALISERQGYLRENDLEILDFSISEDEVLWGGGARALGMNRRGNRLELYNKAHYGYETHSELMNFTMPLVFSSKQYGIHFDNAPIGFLDLDSKRDNSLRYETISGRKTYQVIAGDDWFEIIDHYTTLTGKQPLPPRWALGNFASRFGYHSQQETEATIDEFIKQEVPVDAVVLDLYWFGKEIKGSLGNFEFYKDSFPEPERMIRDFKGKGIKTVLITEPFVLTTSSGWEEALEQDILSKKENGSVYTYDFYFGNTAIIDIFKEEGREWFWAIYKRYTDLGVSGWWGDLGEPEVHPTDLLHATGSADELHNIYGHEWAKLIYEGYEENYPEKRPFILMRAGYSGSQRFGMIPWSGDVNRSWGGLRSQPEIALQMGMQGMGYMHSDLGGFAGPNLDDELYVRWLQYGVFQPIYRPHAQEEVPSEPVFRTPNVLQKSREAIALRYRMLAYNYTLSYLNHRYGQPLMRPLFFEQPEEAFLYNYEETFLWGPDILVSPVLEQGIRAKEVYFPKGSNWYNFYTNELIQGGQMLVQNLSENTIPTYIRGGAFIPLGPVIQNTEAYDPNSLEMHFYYDKTTYKSSGILYHDDGHSNKSFEKGKYELLDFESEIIADQLHISIDHKKGTSWKPEINTIKLLVRNLEEKPTNSNRNFEWDSERKLLKVELSLVPETKNLIIINFK